MVRWMVVMVEGRGREGWIGREERRGEERRGEEGGRRETSQLESERSSLVVWQISTGREERENGFV